MELKTTTIAQLEAEIELLELGVDDKLAKIDEIREELARDITILKGKKEELLDRYKAKDGGSDE
jgi:hypothetical protein